MASLCRSAVASARSAVAGARCSARSSSPNTLFSKPPSLLAPTSRRTSPRLSRLPIELACVDSLMPLHSAIASARLKSFISTDSTCWGWLSLDHAMPR